MSKFIIILLFFSAEKVFGFAELTAQDIPQGLINETIPEIEQKFEAFKENNKQISKSLSNYAISLILERTEPIKSILTQVTSATVLTTHVAKIQLMAEEVINTTISQIHRSFETIQETNDRSAAILSALGYQFGVEINNATSLVNLVGARRSSFGRKYEYDNVSNCTQYSKVINFLIAEIRLDLISCLFRKLKTGQDFIASIDRLCQKKLARLGAMREKLQHCADNIADEESASAAVLCAAEDLRKAKKVSPRFNSELKVLNGKIDSLIKTFHMSVSKCWRKRSINNFRQKLIAVVDEKNTCILMSHYTKDFFAGS